MVFMTPILIILALLQLLIGLAILFESRRSKQAHQKLFVVLLTVLFVWTVSTTLLTYVDTNANQDNLSYFLLVNKLGFSLGSLVLASMYLFNAFYPVKKRLTTFKKAVFYFGILLAAASFLPIVSGNFVLSDGVLHYEYGPLVALIVLYGIIIVTTSVRDNFILRRRSDSKLRQQANTLLVGLTLTIVHALVFIVVLPSIFSTNSLLYSIGYLAPYYYTSFTAYGLLRQGLFDVRAVVARSVGYVLSTALLIVLYAALVALAARILLGRTVDLAELAVFSSVSVIVATTYAPILRQFNKITNRVFYRDAYDAQNLIDELNKIFVSTIHIDELLNKSSQLITTTLKTETCMFIIRPTGKPLLLGQGAEFDHGDLMPLRDLLGRVDEQVAVVSDLGREHAVLKKLLTNSDVGLIIKLVDIKHDNEILGYILLGEKKSGSIYALQDVKLLEIIANEMVIAIQNALRFEEIERFNATLQQKVEEATRKLRRTNEKLRQLDETKDDFISMASHQLRTPLTSVKGYVSMVVEGDAGDLNPMQKKLLNQAFISAQRMVYLISDLLNVSRLRTGKFIIEPVQSNLANIIQEEVRQLVPTAKGRGLELIYHRPEHFPILMFDETKMRQVVMNFIDNAIYYTPTGGSITVSIADKPETIEFTVTDTGIGVPKSDQHHLFSKFYRADNAKRARPDGTGLGLFMAKKVIVAQGGATIFKSQEGKGSTFGFTFAKEPLMPTRPPESHVLKH